VSAGPPGDPRRDRGEDDDARVGSATLARPQEAAAAFLDDPDPTGSPPEQEEAMSRGSGSPPVGPPPGVRDSRVWYLRRLNLFDGMSDADIEAVGHMLRERHCDPGELIFDHDAERVYLLKAGRIRLYRMTADGHDVTTAVLRPGQLFGLGGLLGRSDQGLAEAVEASVICDASASHFLRILAEHPLLMARVTMTMARQMFQMERTIERMSTQRVRSRVATVLLELAEEAVRDGGEPVLALSQSEVAKLVGTTRESVARAVGGLRADGVVAPGSILRILDMDRLRALAASEIEPEEA
jgi:CRP/FNR family transcriptional regulator, cyclic AMP receptor protein